MTTPSSATTSATESSLPSSPSSASLCQVSSYALGLFFILLVSLIWSAASVLVQYLYDGMSFDSPFLLTYIGTSLFILLLPSRLIWERRHQSTCSSSSADDQIHSNKRQDIIIIPWSNNQNDDGSSSRIRNGSAGYSTLNASSPDDHHHHHEQQRLNETIVTNSNMHTTATSSTRQEEDHHLNDSTTTTNHHHRHPGHPENKAQQRLVLLSHEEHIRIAMKIAPVWFIANWSYNASLAYTSISSSTVLASTSSLFTFLIAVTCRDESFSTLTFMGVLLGVCGSILTGWHDLEQHDDTTAGNSNLNNSTSPSLDQLQDPAVIIMHTTDSTNALFGDFLSLLSAVGYAVQVILIRLLCPRDEQSMSMQLLLGYVGLLNAIMFSPVALYQFFGSSAASSPPTAGQLTWTVFGCLVVKGLLDNVLSDYLWARAVVLTTATVATVGLGLTIPLAFISDWILGHLEVVSVSSILGAMSILMGFVLVNLGNNASDNTSDNNNNNIGDGDVQFEPIATTDDLIHMDNHQLASGSQK